MADELVVAGVCPNCGPIHGEALDFNFPAPAECTNCDVEVNKAGVVKKQKIAE